MRYVYPCVLIPEEEGGFYVKFPDVPGALTGADTYEETLFLAEDALLAAVSGYVYLQRDIPVPSPATDGQELVAVPPIAAAKLALYTAMRKQGISAADLAARMNMDEAAIPKLIDPDRYTHITTIMKALRCVGRSIIIEDMELAAPQQQKTHAAA